MEHRHQFRSNNNVVILDALLDSGIPWDLMLCCISSKDEATAQLASRVASAMLHDTPIPIRNRFLKLLQHFHRDDNLFDPGSLMLPRASAHVTTNITAFLSDYIYYAAKEGAQPFPYLSILAQVEETLTSPEPGTEVPALAPYLLLLSILSTCGSPDVIDALSTSPILSEVIGWLNQLDGSEWCGYVDYAVRLMITMACTRISDNDFIMEHLSLSNLSFIMQHYSDSNVWLITVLLCWTLSFTVQSTADIEDAINLVQRMQLVENQDYDRSTRNFIVQLFYEVKAKAGFQTILNVLDQWHEHECTKRGMNEAPNSIEGALRSCLHLFNDIQTQITQIHVPFTASYLFPLIEE